MNFKEIVDRIFIHKDRYAEITDEDKIANFFIINRKLSIGFPEIAAKFNHKNIDKASAIDLWNQHFKNTYRIPDWYWPPKNRVKPTKNKKGNYDLIKERDELKDFEMDFLEKYYEKDLKLEMKKLSKFE